MGELTTFLFATPSILEGLGSIFDFGDTMTEYNTSPSGDIADAIAIACDYEAVACDVTASLLSQAHRLPPKYKAELCQR